MEQHQVSVCVVGGLEEYRGHYLQIAVHICIHILQLIFTRVIAGSFPICCTKAKTIPITPLYFHHAAFRVLSHFAVSFFSWKLNMVSSVCYSSSPQLDSTRFILFFILTKGYFLYDYMQNVHC